MKKILSFVLVLAMIASMMCISVSAADLAYADGKIGTSAADAGRADLVGSHHGKDHADADISDGESSFNTKKHSANVEATLSATVNNRYAIEIYYHVSAIEIAGDATWDVNDLEYENNLTYATAFQNAKDEDTGKPTTKLEGNVKVAEFTLVNYSDLAVKVSVGTELKATKTDIVCKINYVGENDAAATATTTLSKDELAGAYAVGTTGTNAAQTNNYSVDLYTSDWARAFTQMQDYSGTANATSLTVATITITVEP